MSVRSLFVSILLVLTATDGRADDVKKTPLRIDDLYRFDVPTNVVLAPDGKSVVYVRQWIDAATKKERNSLWLVEGGSPEKRRPLEKGEPDGRAPVFSPDGKWLAFVSTRPRPEGWKQTPPVPPESDPAVDIWLIPAAGGQAIPLAGAAKPYGRVFNDGFYGRLAFSPDGKRLAFVADHGRDARTQEEIDADVQVVRPDQGEGYTGYGPAQLWVAQLDATPEKAAAAWIKCSTRDDVWYGDPQWTPDGKRLIVHANKSDDRESARFSINKNFDLWSLELATGKQKRLTTNSGPDVSPRLSPDGKSLVYLSGPRKGSHRDVFNLTVIPLDADNATPKVLFNHHDGAKPLHPPASFPLPYDCWDDSEHLIYNTEAGVRTTLGRVEVASGKGAEYELPKPSREFTPDLVSSLGRRYVLRSLTPPGNVFLNENLLGETSVVKWENDGYQLEGVLTLPPRETAKAPHPLIVFPHGGPHSRSSLAFNFTVEVFAAHGYAVFQPNFRGSFGYGQKFIDADRKDLGGGDMRDILTGIDHLVKEKIVDPKRQFVYGVSYGGYMTTWLVGHTQQFRAAVAQNAVTELNVMWGVSDIPSWTEWEIGGKPWEVADAMRAHSPFTHAAKVKTATLILHSRDDRRCPLPMGRMYYQALKSRGVPTQMVIYPGEGHGIKDPKHREDVLKRTLAWFEMHDKQ